MDAPTLTARLFAIAALGFAVAALIATVSYARGPHEVIGQSGNMAVIAYPRRGVVCFDVRCFDHARAPVTSLE